MLKAAPFLAGYVMLPVVVASALAGGAWTFFPLAFLYIVVPVVDALAGLERRNPADAAEAARLEDGLAFRAVTWLWVPANALLVGWGAARIVSGEVGLLDALGTTVSIGLATGAIGITFAHELVHRPSRLERLLGEILLALASYTHFAIEHVHGHHRHVATPQDPASARFGESFYRFYPRTVLGSLASAWRIEVARQHRRGHGPWTWRNRMLQYAAVQALLYAAVFAWGGDRALLFFVAQGVVGFSLLEVVNYVEHYGLERRATAPGRYERVMPWHSWNSAHRVSNWMLLNLARHSDHHYLAARRYPALEHHDEAPQLPAGYGTMFLVALVPPLWRRVMDPRVAEWRARHLDGAAVAAPTGENA